jgi:hypothetical protein
MNSHLSCPWENDCLRPGTRSDPFACQRLCPMSASDRGRSSIFGLVWRAARESSFRPGQSRRIAREQATNRAFKLQVLPIVAAGYRIDTALPVIVAGPMSWLYWFDMTSCGYVAADVQGVTQFRAGWRSFVGFQLPCVGRPSQTWHLKRLASL